MLYCYYIPGTQFIIDDVLKQMFSMFVLTKRHYTITLLSHKLDTSNSLYKFWFVIMKKNAFNVWYVKLEKESYGHRNLEWKKKFLCKLRFDWLHLCKFSKKSRILFLFRFPFWKVSSEFQRKKKKIMQLLFSFIFDSFFSVKFRMKKIFAHWTEFSTFYWNLQFLCLIQTCFFFNF